MADVDVARAAQHRVGRRHVAVDGRAGGDHLESRPRRVQAGGGEHALGVGALVLRDRQDLAGRRLDHHQHRFAAAGVDRMLGGVLHGPVQRDRHRRRRRTLDLVQYGDVDAVLVGTDDPPSRLAVELVDHRLLHFRHDRRREVGIGGQQLGLGCDHDAGQRSDRREDPVAVVGKQRDQVDRVVGRTGHLGEQLRVVERLVKGVQRVDQRVRGPDQAWAGLGGVQGVVVQVARRQHIGAAELIHRRAPGLLGAQRERLVLPQFGMQPGGRPANLPVPLVAGHLQLTVVAPRPVLG